MMIVACNTATSNTITELRKKYFFPIIGTIPAIKTATQNMKSRTIAVISTPATSKSQALKKLIKDNCQNINVLNIGCKGLVEIIERGELNGTEVREMLSGYLKPIINSNTDCLVLGCTHYPFLKKVIKNIIGSQIKLLDSGKAIARRAQSLLKINLTANNQKKLGKTLYYTTSNSVKFSEVASMLLKTKIKAKQVKT